MCFCRVTIAFIANQHSAIGWMSKSSLLKTGAVSEIQVAATELETATT